MHHFESLSFYYYYYFYSGFKLIFILFLLNDRNYKLSKILHINLLIGNEHINESNFFGISTREVILQVPFVFILCSSKSNVALKITIGLVIDYY